MKPLSILAALILTTMPALADELKGAGLLSEISGNHYDCKMGETPLEWIIAEVPEDAKRVPYTAIVGGKKVEAAYDLNDKGRLTSDGYGEERQVVLVDVGALRVARSDGRVMLCKQR
ncbi:hypothetical protein [Shimia sediminis]|uniref:hypothetical protein n=1 Tax=Shimia sediminis TaxID=2497945 RepID=UPI000F8F779C|nr:hypothetical protein [Shimia sediminis]